MREGELCAAAIWYLQQRAVHGEPTHRNMLWFTINDSTVKSHEYLHAQCHISTNLCVDLQTTSTLVSTCVLCVATSDYSIAAQCKQ